MKYLESETRLEVKTFEVNGPVFNYIAMTLSDTFVITVSVFSDRKKIYKSYEDEKIVRHHRHLRVSKKLEFPGIRPSLTPYPTSVCKQVQEQGLQQGMTFYEDLKDVTIVYQCCASDKIAVFVNFKPDEVIAYKYERQAVLYIPKIKAGSSFIFIYDHEVSPNINMAHIKETIEFKRLTWGYSKIPMDDKVGYFMLENGNQVNVVQIRDELAVFESDKYLFKNNEENTDFQIIVGDETFMVHKEKLLMMKYFQVFFALNPESNYLSLTIPSIIKFKKFLYCLYNEKDLIIEKFTNVFGIESF